jgi:hypothetical protein
MLALPAPIVHAQSNRVSTVAGTGTSAFTGDGGPASSAPIAVPVGVTPTPDGGYLIAEQGTSRVRFVAPDGTISTVAGSGVQGFGGDGGPATAAALNAPSGAAMTAEGGILIADANNNRIRYVTPAGIIQTVAGTGPATFGGDGGPAASAQINFPYDVVVTPDGGYLIADVDNNRIRSVSPAGTISTVAGNGGFGSGGDGGPATSAQLADPSGVALTPDGGLLIGDMSNNRVRRVAPDGTITTAAGTGPAGSGGDGGPATAANLNSPIGVAAAADGSYLIADRFNHRVRRVTPDGTITTAVGTGSAGFNGDGALGPDTQLNEPFDVAINQDGDYLIADEVNHRIRSLDAGAASLVLDPVTAERTPGDANVVAATVRHGDGSPAAGRTVRFAITGPNAGTGTATADAAGAAGISWAGVNEGTDTLEAYLDLNGNGAPDAGEPVAVAEVRWVLPLPRQGRTMNIEPVSGIVRIRTPGSSRARASAAVTLTEARQLPIGSIVDVRKGRVRMTTAANRVGAVQKGEFYGGIYTTSQSRRARRPTTLLRLTEALVCRRGRSRRARSGRARVRRLWGSARGRYRLRGRHSSATVRGTIWLQRDTCATTTTVVREGTVIVRDFAKRRNIRLRAGRRYVARPLRR